jgi:O-antigen/teichoic acid export membrane protein
MEGIPFRFAVPVLPILLGGYYVFVTDASSISKSFVTVLLVLSVAMLFATPSYWLWALLVQVAVGIFVAFYLAWKRQWKSDK